MSRRVILSVICAAALIGLLSGCDGAKKADATPAGCASTGLTDHTSQTYCGLELTPAQPRPQFTMTDMTGKQVRFAELTGGKPTLLFFGYTTCPDVCPETMADIANALRQGPANIRSQTQVIFVSTDPATDTSGVIKAWLGKIAPDLASTFIGLRGTNLQVQAAEVAAHVTTSSEDGKTHSAEVLLYGADDYARVAFLQSADETADMAHDLRVVIGSH